MVSTSKLFRGGILLTRTAFVRKKYGIDGIRSMRSEIVKKGYKVPDHNKIRIADWYPNEYNIEFLKIFKDLYGESAFIRLSKDVPFETEGFVKHFVKWPDTAEELFSNANKLWSLFYNFGRLEGELTCEREGVLYGYEISDDPVFCEYLTYYFESLLEHVIKTKVNTMHTECVFSGNNREKWEFRW